MQLMRGEVQAGMRLLEATAVAATAGEISDPAYAGYACCYLITACHEVRDIGRASEWCDRLDEHCKTIGYYALQQVCRTEYAGVLVEQGEWERADRELLAAADILAVRRPPLVAGPLVRLGELRRRQGRVAEAIELFGQGQRPRAVDPRSRSRSRWTPEMSTRHGTQPSGTSGSIRPGTGSGGFAASSCWCTRWRRAADPTRPRCRCSSSERP